LQTGLKPEEVATGGPPGEAVPPAPVEAASEASTTADDAAAPLERGFAWARSLVRNLLPFLAAHRGTFTIVGALMCVELAISVGQRKAFGILIDDAILKADFRLLMLILGLLLAATLVNGVATLTYEWMYSKLCARVPGEVRAAIFAHIQRLPLGRLRTSRHGDLIARLTNDAASVEPALWSLGYIAIAAGGIVFSLAMLFYTEWRLTLVGIVLLPLSIVGPRVLSPHAARYSYTAKTRIGDLGTHMQENLANQIVLRVFGLAGTARRRFDERNERIMDAAWRYNVTSYYSHRIPSIVIDLIELAMLALGGWMVVRGELTPGGLIAFYLLFSGLCAHTWTLTASAPSLINASAAMRRVREVLDDPVPAERPARGEHFEGLRDGLRFEDVSFSYDGERNQLESMSLAIRPGEMVAFVGASGSGKSTALQLLLGLQTPNAGRIVIGGHDLAALSQTEYWSRVSAVFQDSLLFHASIAENIRAGHVNASDDQVKRAARAADIDAWVETLPEGYDTIVAGDTCSGGQRQRLALARALVREPELLVLDEPTSALDAATGAAVMKTLREVAVGRTVVLVTHQLRDAADASRIVVFDAGRVAEIGPHAELLARGGVYARLWERQRESSWRGTDLGVG
jgi:ATP-binding cassette, subfamily B, bacterial